MITIFRMSHLVIIFHFISLNALSDEFNDLFSCSIGQKRECWKKAVACLNSQGTSTSNRVQACLLLGLLSRVKDDLKKGAEISYTERERFRVTMETISSERGTLSMSLNSLSKLSSKDPVSIAREAEKILRSSTGVTVLLAEQIDEKLLDGRLVFWTPPKCFTSNDPHNETLRRAMAHMIVTFRGVVPILVLIDSSRAELEVNISHRRVLTHTFAVFGEQVEKYFPPQDDSKEDLLIESMWLACDFETFKNRLEGSP
jgi:hypothetical protein